MFQISKAAACGLFALASAMALVPAASSAQGLPAGYPASYADTIAKATAEGSLLVYSSTDSSNVIGLIDGFKARYPGIAVDYLDLSSNDVYTRLTSEAAAGVRTADLAWAGAATVSSMIKAGLAEAYETPEKPHLLPGAIWQDMAFSITIEPIVTIYNKRLLDAALLPKTHADLAALLETRIEPGQFATYDPARSTAGLAYAMSDEEQGADAFWALARAMGKARASLYASASSMVEKVASGEHIMAYNVSGSTAAKGVLDNPDSLGLVKFCDHTSHLVRVMMIPAAAEHKNAARLFIDYALSAEGQSILTRTPFGTVRADLKSEPILAMPEGCEKALVMMPPGEGALRPNDEAQRTEFLAKWQTAFEGK